MDCLLCSYQPDKTTQTDTSPVIYRSGLLPRMVAPPAMCSSAVSASCFTPVPLAYIIIYIYILCIYLLYIYIHNHIYSHIYAYIIHMHMHRYESIYICISIYYISTFPLYLVYIYIYIYVSHNRYWCWLLGDLVSKRTLHTYVKSSLPKHNIWTWYWHCKLIFWNSV